MRRYLGVLLVLGLSAGLSRSAPPTDVKLDDDPPAIAAPKSGEVAGRIVNGDKVAELSAVSRVTGQTYKPKTWDKPSGRFTFAALPGDARYDIIIKTTDGRELEGIDLDFADLRMVRLAGQRRKELGLPPERNEPFVMEDVTAITSWIAKLKDFMEIRRPLYIHGNGRRCTVLVELMRTREHYSGDGRYVWRVELWYFENQFGGWEKVPNQERVLRRQRITPADWTKIHLEYFPELSALVEPNGYCRQIEFTVPPKGDLSRGRLPGTEPEVKTEAHLSGLAKEAEKDAEQAPPAKSQEPAKE